MRDHAQNRGREPRPGYRGHLSLYPGCHYHVLV